MHASDTEAVEFASYRLQDLAVFWYDSWKRSKGPKALPSVWKEFSKAFLRHYLPVEIRRARVDKFLNLRQGSTLSYVSPFVANKFGFEPELISKPLVVSIPIGDSMIARRVYRGCTVMICSCQTSANLFELEIVDFDVIMGMDWLASCYANVDCRTKMVSIQFPGEPVIEWKGNIAMPKDRIISYIKARKMILKDVFPDELPGLPPIREIEFSIDVFPDTQPISIPPYRMAPAELRKLKA
ncbi:uncharacterized protein [Nicotiana sylvestris]|uniref:uncharacterized protein n=1 Tax=Nicotiana sylvestris TaxID=4096 RepID=UPI00388C36A9